MVEYIQCFSLPRVTYSSNWTSYKVLTNWSKTSKNHSFFWSTNSLKFIMTEEE